MNVSAQNFLTELSAELANGQFDLPPFPETAMRVQRCIADSSSSVSDLAAIISSEPTLAARLMRMANSVMMRRGPIEVTDINTAIARVGRRMVQNAAVSFAARQAFDFPANSPFADDLTKLRRQTIHVASLGYVLAKHTSFRGKADEAMLAGLLHSVGKFHILTKTARLPGVLAERNAVMGLQVRWHTGVARAILESWGFPESMASGIDEQELKTRDRLAAADLSDVLYIANILARAGVKAAPMLADRDSLARLRITATELEQLLEEHAEEIESMAQALSG